MLKLYRRAFALWTYRTMLELFRSRRRALLWLTEAVLMTVCLLAAARIRFGFVDLSAHLWAIVLRSTVATLVLQASLYYNGLYTDELLRSAQRLLFSVAQAMAAGAVVLWLVYYVIPPLALGRGIFVPAILLATLALVAHRLVHHAVSKSPTFVRRTLVLGSGALAREIADLIETRALGLSLVGMLRRPSPGLGVERAIPGPPRTEIFKASQVIGTYDDLSTLALRHGVDLVIVADGDRRGTLPVEQLLSLKFNGIQIQEGVDFYEQTTGKICVQEIKPSQFIFSDGFANKRSARRLKRLFDIVISAFGLVVSAPVMLLTAIAIKLDSEGPTLYRQVRLGEFGREFVMLKFRSMRSDAEKDGARWAAEKDQRITRVGGFLRKARLDELPQLWNVLRGDMSLVGPRPERPIFVAELERRVPFFRQRLHVKPGLTGHAQVRCRYAASVEDSLEKLQYDLYYVKSFSVFFDLSVLFDTFKVVVRKIGAR